MPTSVGPKTYGKDNLVFGYDTGDTINSFIGKPTTNLATAIQSRGGDVTADPTDMPPLPRYIAPEVYCSSKVEESTTSWQSLFQYNTAISVADGERFIVTAWVFVPEGKTNNRFNINCSVDGANTGLTQNPSHDIPTGRWVKLLGSYTNSTGAAVSITSTRVETYTAAEWTGNITCWAANFMVEKGSDLPSAFRGSPAIALGDTRSVSGSLLDITNNSTVDITNMAFDSSAQPDWDGSTDYITTETPSDFRMGSGSFTLEAVAKQDITSAHVLLEARGSSLTGYLWTVNYGNVGGMSIFYNDNTGGQNIHYQTGDYDITSTQDYYHLVARVDRGSNEVSFFINGEQAGNAVDLQHTGSISPTGGDYYRIGWDKGGVPWNGQIPIFKHYNRALTISEVKANYNAIKGRFNI